MELATLSLLYDEQGRVTEAMIPMFLPALVALKSTGPGLWKAIPWGCRAAGRPSVPPKSMQGSTVAFAPLADGSDFTAAYREIPYTEVVSRRTV